MTALLLRNSKSLCYWISVLLLLILIQMLTSLVVFSGEFICSSEMAISPFHFCLIQHGEKFCDVSQQPDSDIMGDTLRAVIIFSLYVPLVFVAFALLSMLFVAYSRGRGLLWLSAALQAASSLLILTGVIAFVAFNRSYLRWEHLTIWFYICSGVHLELAFMAALTCVSADKMNSYSGRNGNHLAEEMP